MVQPPSPHAAAALPAGGFSPQPPPPQPPSGPMRTQLRAWLTEAEPSIDALFIARDEIVAAAALADFAATGAACQSAAGAVANTEQHLPSPDPALNIELRQALTKYQVGIRHCISGTQNRNAIEIGEATVYINQGTTDLRTAVDMIESDLSSDASGRRVLTV
jgi:hypothetical protein